MATFDAAVLAPLGGDVVFAAIAEAWFELLADGDDAADLAAGPGTAGATAAAAAASSAAASASGSVLAGGECGAAPPLLDLLAGVRLSAGVLGAYTPTPLLEPTHLEVISHGFGGPYDYAPLCTGGLAAADAAGGGGRGSARLCRSEWCRMMRGCHEAMGPSLFLQKALAAVGPHGRSLLGHLVLLSGQGFGGCYGGPSVLDGPLAASAALTLLRATELLPPGPGAEEVEPLRRFLRCGALPDGEALAMAPQLEDLLSLHLRMQAIAASEVAALYLSGPDAGVEVAATPPLAEINDSLVVLAEAAPPPPPSPPALPLAKVAPLEGILQQALEDTGAEAPPLKPYTPLGLAVGRVGVNLVEGLLVDCASSCPAPAPLLPAPTDGEGACDSLKAEVVAAEKVQCCICFDSFQPADLRRCGRPDCVSPYCLDCLRRHAESVVGDSLYAVPAVRCPSCNRRVATEAWTPHVGAASLAKYRENARALLTYRCPACDETSSYLADSGLHARDPFVAFDVEVRQRLGDVWRRFYLGECHAEEFLQVVLAEHSCGHRNGGTPPARMSRVFGPSGGAPWISDLERRLALQLAWLHRFPRQRTPCCGERFCFRCKVSSWHRGVTCRERLRSEKTRQAQICPGCGVPTQRSEGCHSIACVCGRVWEWEGDDSSEEDGTLDDASDEEVEEQARAAVDLIAMNRWATEESVSDALRALVDARADLNNGASASASSGSSGEGRATESGGVVGAATPLLFAAQHRNTTAAKVLCELGARVTVPVLEEVRGISSDEKRKGMEEILRPHLQSDTSMRLPLWVWIQAGCVSAVEALLRNAAHEEEIGEEVLDALSRCSGEEASKLQISMRVKEQVGEETFDRLQVSAATSRLLQELRQGYEEERSIDVRLIRDCLASGADPNAREEEDDDGYGDEGSRLGITALGLLAMNCQASGESISSGVEALLAARADVNLESDELSTPLQAALQHRNVAAIGAFCRAPVRFTPELLDEARTVSEPSRRRQVEELLQPIVRGHGDRELPLWVRVQAGDIAAVQTMLEAATEGPSLVDTDAVVALQRFRGCPSVRQQLDSLLRGALGSVEFGRMQASAATWRLVQELREAYDDQRSVVLELVLEALTAGADPNAHEDAGDFDDGVRDYAVPAFHLLVTNLYTPLDSMCETVSKMVEAKADLSSSSGDTPLVAAMQNHCVAGVEALCRHGAKVTPQVFEEMKNISSTRNRQRIEDLLQPLVLADASLRCPLWIWVQAGSATAVEALLRNSAHEEEVTEETLVALQRCRGSEAARQQISARICQHVGVTEFQRLGAMAAARRLLMELREAYGEKRDFDRELVREALAQGANPNAREETMDDAEDDLDDEEEDEEEEEEDEEDEEEDEDDDDDEEDTDAPSEDDAEEETGHQPESEDSGGDRSRDEPDGEDVQASELDSECG
eukprot:TRINITY_DN22_c0_g3_i1.p1 TRINITY_DN22_c0_g3~~TRINITY_DN22_c0_g3_i1.p1  ORF type:complete len:1433 (-),score=369.84 TRINITY_DN22_c0_g3_i1:79-4377(-)